MPKRSNKPSGSPRALVILALSTLVLFAAGEAVVLTRTDSGRIIAAKYLHVEERDGTRKEGIGIVVEQTSAPFIPKGHVVYAMVAQYDPLRKAWNSAKNPG